MNGDRMNARIQGFEFENIFDSISDLVSIHDCDFKIIRANRALCKFLGKSEEELIGQACYTVFHNRDSSWSNCPHAEMLDKRTPVTELVEDGHIGIPILVTCSPVYDENNVILGSVHVARDVANQRSSELHKDAIIAELQAALSQLKELSGILTICASCKDIRSDEEGWERVEKYIAEHTGAVFSHGICPRCFSKLYPELKEF